MVLVIYVGGFFLDSIFSLLYPGRGKMLDQFVVKPGKHEFDMQL
jgi:hypothetical protein